MANWTEADKAAYYARTMGGGRQEPASKQYVTLCGTRPIPVIPVTARACDPKASKMNKTEQAFSRYLDLRKMAGEVVWFDFGVWTFKLGDDCRFTPDFPVLMPDGTFRIYDTKGRTKNKSTGASMAYAEDDAKVKIRVAAKMYPMFRWFFTFQEKNGEWTEMEF